MLIPILVTITMPAPQEITLKAGQAITRSAKVRKATYDIANGDQSGKTGAITIRGNNITVDFNGAVLRGTPATVEPDQRKGTAIIVRGRNITIKNLNLHGYRNGIIATNSPGIKILNCDLSYN